MAKYNIKQAPYYDDYDSSKQYTQLLAIPGRVAQAREITQIQSTMKDIIKSVGDSLLRDGNIIEGCQVLVNASKTAATVTEGKIYINGMVLPLATTTIAINGVGTEVIGVKLMETLITESDDPTLRDPAQGYDNHNQAGCHRIKSWIDVVKDDPDAAILATLIDGDLSVETYAPDYDALIQTLARRTYDESGSYIVEGLNVRVEANSSDDTKFNVVVEAGKAYVLGYELKIPVARRLTLPRPMTHSSVTANNFWYTPTQSSYPLAGAPYVRDITTVKGFVSKTVNQTITSNVDRVLFDESEVSQITSVSQGDTVYTIGTASSGDCYLQREGTRYYLKWNGTNNFPTLEASYAVTYVYHHTFMKGTDYELTHNPVDDSHNLTWIEGGITPDNDKNFTVIYDQYLARKDIVYIDRYGDINVIQGTPAEYGFEVLPEAPINTLALAYIMSPPNGSITVNPNLAIQVANVGLTRFTMVDIQRLLNRIRTLEYDQTILSLNETARQYETTSTKKGIFTDPFIDLSKIDLYYNLSNGVIVDESKPIFDALIDLGAYTCSLPQITKTYDTVYDTKSTTHKYSRVATLETTGESVILAQPKATKSFLVNPYSMFPQMPEVSVDPAVDNWIEETVITVPVSLTSREVVSTSTRTVTASTSRLGDYTTTSSSTRQVGTRTETTTSSEILSEEAITYIRQRTLTVEGTDFAANLDNIKCYFDNVYCPLTPIEGTLAGTEEGSVKADGNGRIKATFQIPANILTGVREVLLKSTIQIDGYITEGFTLYQASGISRTIQNTVTTITTILLHRTRTVTHYIDPVGQTFVLDSLTLIKGVDLYFENKPSTNTSISCEIRGVTNGLIDSTVYAHKSLPASGVTVSSDASKATRFDFSDPVLLEENKEYAFVVRSVSDDYRIWVAELGGTDIITGNPVLANPYLIGVMMSSSNNSSWTLHQTTDIKFRLIADTYNTSSELYLEEITSAEEFSKLNLMTDTIIPNGTSIKWYYSIDSGTSYQNISPYNLQVLDHLKDKVIFKAILSRNENTALSPVIALDAIGVTLSCHDLTGYYITKNITGLDPYTSVDIVIDSYVPSNTSIKVYVSRDNGETMTQATLDGTKTRLLNSGWKEQNYHVTVSSSTQCRVYVQMAADYKYLSPIFRRLRVIMS